MDCSLPDFSVQEVLQARILEWIAMPSSRIFLTQGLNLCLFVSCIGWWVLYHWSRLGSPYATWGINKFSAPPFSSNDLGEKKIICYKYNFFLFWKHTRLIGWKIEEKHFHQIFTRLTLLEPTLSQGTFWNDRCVLFRWWTLGCLRCSH